jgi:hypothetical protein
MSDRTNYCTSCKGYADRIAALEAENARLRNAVSDAASMLAQAASGEATTNDLETWAEDMAEVLKAWRDVTD